MKLPVPRPDGTDGIDVFSPGQFRHSVATWAFEQGADPAAVSAFLGHKSPATTKKFYATLATVPKIPTLAVNEVGRHACKRPAPKSSPLEVGATMKKRNTEDRRATGASTKRTKVPGAVMETKYGPIRTLPRDADDDERFASEVDRLRYILVVRDIFEPVRIRWHELQATLPKRLKGRGVKVKEVDAYLARLPAKRHNQTAPARKGRAARRAERTPSCERPPWISAVGGSGPSRPSRSASTSGATAWPGTSPSSSQKTALVCLQTAPSGRVASRPCSTRTRERSPRPSQRHVAPRG